MHFIPIPPENSTRFWALLCEGLKPMEAAFGPEGNQPRPRPQDSYFLVRLDDRAVVGMIWTQRPSPTTVAFGMGLFESYRGRAIGPKLRDAVYDFIFTDKAVHKIETEVYASNAHSLGALHGPYRRSREEGRQRETIQVNGIYYDRILFGITRKEWQVVRFQERKP
jgi:RimJ/RimL family protein N-acetyltransferase